MSDDSTDVETAIIHEAYADKVKDAFMVFAENLGVGESEKACKDRFLRALLLVKKARDLALDALSGVGVGGLEAASAENAPGSGESPEALSEADQAMIEQLVGGTTGIAKPVRLR